MMATQTFWAIALGALLGAGEIAEDLRTGALVFYLGRPLTRREYVLGKALAVSVPVLLVTLVPVLLLFATQALFEGSWSWLAAHAGVPFSALGYSLVLCLFISGVVLGVSAVARRRRWATVAVVGILVTLWAVASIVAPPFSMTSGREQHAAERMANAATTEEQRALARRMIADSYDTLGSPSERAEWLALSPVACLSAVGRDLFGIEVPANFPWKRHWVLVFGASAALYGVLWRRVRAVEVVA
jgi:ABC-type transport system involved in multi-copper enzyme maturation permease subunit